MSSLSSITFDPITPTYTIRLREDTCPESSSDGVNQSGWFLGIAGERTHASRYVLVSKPQNQYQPDTWKIIPRTDGTFHIALAFSEQNSSWQGCYLGADRTLRDDRKRTISTPINISKVEKAKNTRWKIHASSLRHSYRIDLADYPDQPDWRINACRDPRANQINATSTRAMIEDPHRSQHVSEWIIEPSQVTELRLKVEKLMRMLEAT